MRTSHQPGIISGRWRLWNRQKEFCVYRRPAFTDVWGAKRAGIPNILVKPIHPKEEIQIVLEALSGKKIVLHFYKKSQRHEKKVEK